jgi:nucleoid-associated protein YgaU
MTRETKIGLLVGLAFIIVIGILLSDHVTSTTEPLQAQQGKIGNNVRQSVNTPGTDAPAIARAPMEPSEVAPRQQVPTRRELIPPAPIVQVRDGALAPPAAPNSDGAPVAPDRNPAANPSQMIADHNQPGPATNLPTHVDPGTPNNEAPMAFSGDAKAPPPLPSRLERFARAHQEELVPVNHTGDAPRNGSISGASTPAVREYKAEAGDTLSKLAARFMGGNTKANRDAIVRENPVLTANPDKIVIGRTYLIPIAARAGTALAENAAPSHPKPPVAYNNSQRAIAGSLRPYTVQEGDSLWRIAEQELGSGQQAAQLKELNADVLHGSDALTVGMVLKLPAKQLATAQ